MGDSDSGREPEKRILEDEAASDAKRARIDEAEVAEDSTAPNGATAEAADVVMKEEPAEVADVTEKIGSEQVSEEAEVKISTETEPAAEDEPTAENEPAAEETPTEPAPEAAAEGEAEAAEKSESDKQEEPNAEPATAEAEKPKDADGTDGTEPPADETPIERAKRAAEKVRVIMPEELDGGDPSDGLPKHQHKYILSAVKAIKRLKDAGPFLQPVDPEKLGIPQYFDFIKEPMDLGTIETNLNNNTYSRVQDVVNDFNLMVSNAIVFNGEESPISQMGIGLTGALRKHLTNMPLPEDADAKKKRATSVQSSTRNSLAGSAVARESVEAPDTPAKQMQAPGVPVLRRESAADGRPKREIHPPKPRDLPYGSDLRPRNKKFAAELKFAGQVLRELTSRKHESIAYPFLQPVDPVALGIPNYFEVIKEPMDLGTIQAKLNEGAYYNADEFEADVRLMFRNCFVFNPDGTPVNDLGHKLEALFDKRWLEKPLPAPTPPPMIETDSSDYDEEYDEAGITNPAIKVLEEQLTMMKQQLHRLKREAIAEFRDKRKKKGARSSMQRRSTNPGDRRKSNGVGGAKDDYVQPTHITYDMKKELSEKIGTLPEKKLRRVVAIIQESMPQLANSGQEEIELDMDQLEPHTLRQLYNFVVRRQDENGDTGDKTVPGAGNGFHQKKKKSKPLTEDEQNRQIEEIQNKLRQFEQLEGKPVTEADLAPAAAPENSSSDEDDAAGGPDPFSDDSSSEEE